MKLTQRSTATGVTLNQTFIHVVNTNDLSQNPAGSSYKAPLSLLSPLFTGGTGGGSFTGNTSATCITDLYVTNIHGCSPITVHDSIQSVNSQATGTTSFALGIQTKAYGPASTASGYQTLANYITDTAIGYQTFADSSLNPNQGPDPSSAYAEGKYTSALAQGAHAEGFQTTAYGSASHAEGGGTIASGLTSHSEGSLTTAIGDYSHAGGNISTASGIASFVHSTSSLVTGDRSVLLGGQNITGTTNDTVYVPDFVIKKTASVPVNSADTIGEPGSVTWDDTYFYWKTNVGWLRISGSTF